MVPFILIGGIGLVAVLVSLFFGEILDLLDGAISMTAIGSAFTVFGAVGAIVIATGLPDWSAYVISAVLGILVPADPTGLFGTARSTITGAFGEVSLDGPNEIETRMAYSDERIEPGTRVRVIELQGTRVRVEPVNRPTTTPDSDPA